MHYFKAALSTDNVLFHSQSSRFNEEEPFVPTAEIEAQTIGNLLPDEDDLFSEVFNEFEYAKGSENTEDFDLFSSIGGLELEGDDRSFIGKRELDFAEGVSIGRGSSFSANNFGPNWIGNSNQGLVRRCNGFENDGTGLSKSTNDILPSQSMFGGFGNGSLNGMNDGSSFILNSFPSSLNVAHTGDHFGLSVPKSGVNYIPTTGPCSVPDYANNVNYFNPYESGSNVSNIAGTVDRGNRNRLISAAGAIRQPMEPQGLMGQFGTAICPIHGQPWSNCSPLHRTSLGHKVWPNSPLLPNMISASSSPQNSGFSAYCSGSLGSMGHVSSFPFHPMARGSSILSHAGQNYKKASNDVMNSSIEMAHSLGSTREIWRNLSRRRSQGNYSHANKKEFDLDIERILRGEDGRTTLMLKNIPNKYSSKMLLGVIDEQCKGIYDFVYLPIDFKNNCNVGYAFINLIDPLQIVPFYKCFNGKKWEKFNSEKVAALKYARIQGKSALIAHFQNSSLMNEDKRCRPVLFCTDGPNAGEQEPFPVGTNIRVKTSKVRGSATGENRRYDVSPSTSPNSIESDPESISPKSVIA